MGQEHNLQTGQQFLLNRPASGSGRAFFLPDVADRVANVDFSIVVDFVNHNLSGRGMDKLLVPKPLLYGLQQKMSATDERVMVKRRDECRFASFKGAAL